jgi:hypothetical protein
MTTAPKTLRLVGCGKTKAAAPCPAKELYLGQLFRLARAHVEATGDDWAILSAKHGLVWPDDLVEPYEQRMHTSSEMRRWWAGQVRTGYLFWVRKHDLFAPNPVSGRMEIWDGVRVCIYAGRDYIDPILEWSGIAPASIEQPLAGLGIGQRLKFFMDALEKSK